MEHWEEKDEYCLESIFVTENSQNSTGIHGIQLALT